MTVCTLCSGTAFGECVLNDGYHSVSVISNESCTLLRVSKVDFQDIWQKSSHYMEDIVTPPFSLSNIESSSKLTMEKSDQSLEDDTETSVSTVLNPEQSSQNQNNPTVTIQENVEEIELPEHVCFESNYHLTFEMINTIVEIQLDHEADACWLGDSADN